MEESQRVVQKEGIAERIWKYKLHYIIVLPALLLIFAFKFIPMLWGLYLPFVDYQVFKGLFGSSFVGLDNFTRLFGHPPFWRVLLNTLGINLGYVAAAAVISLLLALALGAIRSARLQALFSTLFLMPFFIPTIVVAYAATLLLSMNHPPFYLDKLLLADPGLFRPIVVGVEVLRTCGIPVLIALAAIRARRASLAGRSGSYWQTDVIPALRAIVAFMLIQLSTMLSTNFELMNILVNPLVYETGDTLSTYQFRTGLMNAEMSMAAAVGFIQFVIQLICVAAAYLLIKGWFVKDLFHPVGSDQPAAAQAKDPAASIIGTAVSVLYGAVVVFLLYVIFLQPFMTKGEAGIRLWDLLSPGSVLGYPILALIAVIMHLFITVTLAYPLTVKDLPGRGFYKAYLMVILVFGSGSISEYLFYHKLGMVNTGFPYVTIGFFSIVSVFVLKSIFNSKYGALKEEAAANGHGELHSFFYIFIPKIWKPLIALGVLQFVTIINSYHTSLVYTVNPDNFSSTLMFRMLATGSMTAPGDPVVMQYGALISLPGIVLLLIFRKQLTSEVLISQTIKL